MKKRGNNSHKSKLDSKKDFKNSYIQCKSKFSKKAQLNTEVVQNLDMQKNNFYLIVIFIIAIILFIILISVMFYSIYLKNILNYSLKNNSNQILFGNLNDSKINNNSSEDYKNSNLLNNTFIVNQSLMNNSRSYGSDTGSSSGGNLGGESSGACILNCTDKTCGDDSCSGSCGSCESGYDCENYNCFLIDNDYPIFSSFFDDSFSLNMSGRANFIVNVTSTNSSVFLRINNQNYKATNLVGNNYNVSVYFSNAGSFSYYWYSYGNGTRARYNSSLIRNYRVNGTEIHITQDWLDSQGKSPYYLDVLGATYILEIDVTTPGTAFVILANDINFNLNRHTIVYSDYDPLIIENSDFEESVGRTVPGWDLTNAPDANVSRGSFVQPVSVYSGNNSFNFQVFTNRNNDQEIKTSSMITLEANTTYTLSAMFFNSVEGNYSCGGDICTNNFSLYVGFEGTNISTSKRGTSWRGFQYSDVEFTTGIIPESFQIIAGVKDVDSRLVENGTVYLDDIKIQKTKNFGVLIGSVDWNKKETPDVKRYPIGGRIMNQKVFNGTIIQGRGGSSLSHGLNALYTRSGELYHLNITSYGADSNVLVFDVGGTNYNVSVHDNILNSNVKTLRSRDNFYATVLKVSSSQYTEIYNNIIYGGPHAGIVVWSGNSSHLVYIYNNTVSTNTYYSNGFAIVNGGNSCAFIYDNKIDCITGAYSCRGMAISGVKCNGSKVYNNYIEIRELKRNQEYNGCCLGGGYGVQFEYMVDNLEFFNNTIKAYSSECEGSSFRVNIYESPAIYDFYVHDNIFEGIKQGNNSGPDAYSIKIDNFDDPNKYINFVNNRIITNSKWIVAGNLNGFYARSNIFEINPIGKDNPFEPFLGSYWPYDQINAANNLRFIDNRYSSDEARSEFVNSSFMHYSSNNHNYRQDPYSNFYFSWSTNVSVADGSNNPINGASIVIKNNNDTEIFNGLTDINGKVSVILDEFYNHGGNKTDFNPYTISISKTGYNQFSNDYIVNRTLNIVVDLTEGSGIILASSSSPVDKSDKGTFYKIFKLITGRFFGFEG